MRLRQFVVIFAVFWLLAWGVETALAYCLCGGVRHFLHWHNRPETLAGAAETMAPCSLVSAVVCFLCVTRLR